MSRLLVAGLALTTAIAPQIPVQAAPLVPVQEARLPNGLQVLMVERHRVPAFSLQMWYRVGSRNESPGLTGLSHLLEHLHYLGTRLHPTGEYDRLVESNGGADNASTTSDFTDYYLDMASQNLETAIALEADAMAHLTVPPARFASELQVVREERRMRLENSPAGLMGEQIGALAYCAHSYRWPVLGWKSDLDHVTRTDALAYYRTYYHPRQATLVLVGDFDPQRAMTLIRRYFGPIPEGTVPPEVRTVEPIQLGERRAELVRDVETPAVMAAFHMPPVDDPDTYALVVMAELLAKGESSRLYKRLVDREAIAQSIDASANEQRDPGLFTVSAVPTPGHTTAQLEAALYAELDRLKTEPVNDTELTKARHLIEADYLLGLQHASGLASELGTYAVLKDYRVFTSYLDRIRAVTAADVQRVARQTFRKENRSVVTLVPRKEATP